MNRLMLLALLLISACAPSPESVQTAIAQTQTANPTSTLTPSKTSTTTPRSTATQSHSPTPRSTATQTFTPTPRQALQVSRKDFVTYPEKYTGQYVVVTGIVFNIINNTELQIYFGGEYNSPVYVEALKPFDDIYEDDDVVVYGIAGGSHCGTNVFGGSVCSAMVADACITHTVYKQGNVKQDKKTGVRPTPDFSLSECP